MEVGAVAAMRYVSDGIKAARLVMQHTEHTLLVGEQASRFAISMGLPGPTDLSSEESIEKWVNWKKNSCQPNFRKNVLPVNDCGPYHLNSSTKLGDKSFSNNERVGLDESRSYHFGLHNHDTIAMAVIDKVSCCSLNEKLIHESPLRYILLLQKGLIAVGTSTNGATFKIPGRL